MSDFQFKYYVMNDRNGKIQPFNIFDNMPLQERVEKEVRKYLRGPANYFSRKYNWETKTDDKIYGFAGLCHEVNSAIMWQEWSRCEYEIIVGSMFESDLQKIDCYEQCKPNIEAITREVIYQYKQYKKRVNNG